MKTIKDNLEDVDTSVCLCVRNPVKNSVLHIIGHVRDSIWCFISRRDYSILNCKRFIFEKSKELFQ